MSAVNTYHTLNEYRLSTDSVYENGSHSKLGAAALVAVIFLSAGAYFFYPMFQPSANTTPDTTPVSSGMNFQAPAAFESATPADTTDSAALLDTPNTAAISPTVPSTDTNATRTSTQEPAVNRSVTATTPTVSPAQPAPRAKQPAKPLPQSTPIPQSTSKPAPTSIDNTATATPEMTTPAPIVAPQPAPFEAPLAIEPEAPTDVAPDTTAGESTGG